MYESALRVALSFDKVFLHYGYEEVYSAKVYTGVLLQSYVIVPPKLMKLRNKLKFHDLRAVR